MEKHHHYILHKPLGFLSQFVNNQTKRKNKKLLGSLHSFAENTMAIGRLDEDSEGLLLLTTDGKVSEAVRSRTVEKEYYVQVDGDIPEDAIQKLTEGLEIRYRGKSYYTRQCSVRKLSLEPDFPPRTKKIRDIRHGPTSWVSITLTEGKFRQVRKMTAAVGFPTLRLVRVRIGAIVMSTYQPGKVIEVDSLENRL